MNRKNVLLSVAIIATFLFANYGRASLYNLVPFRFDTPIFQLAYIYCWWIIPVVIVTGLMFGAKNILQELGLDKGFLIGFIFSAITVSPMLISSAIAGEVIKDISWIDLSQKTIVAGFAEEFLYRGFLFGILFNRLRWGFIPASVLGALIFGLGHIYQGTTLGQTIGVFLITAVGAVWFAWLYIEWNNNLWVPIFLHTLMNLSWILFEVSTNALGGVYTNIFRFITITLTIVITILYNKKTGLKITRKNLITNKLANK